MAIATASDTTIRPAEAEHFGKLAAEWWDPAGSSSMLHKLNPVRLGFIRDAIDLHFGVDLRSRTPLAGKRVLDVGCGAGLLTEPLARLGGDVTGIDAAAPSIAVARKHAAASRLSIRYEQGELSALNAEPFDLVTTMEVIEHVEQPGVFVQQLAQRLSPDGLLILSTPNRTVRSRLLMVELAERTGHIPRGTHDWDRFLAPDDLRQLLAAAGLAMEEPRGIVFSPTRGIALGDDLSLNYIVTAKRA